MTTTRPIGDERPDRPNAPSGPQVPDPPRSTDDDPTGVRELLAALPDPGPMPADLVSRITASLEAEARGRQIPAAPPVELAPVIPLSGATRTRRRPGRRTIPLLLGAAAAVTAVGLATPALLEQLHGRSDVSATLDTSATARQSPPGMAVAVAPDLVPVQVRLSRTVPGDDLLREGRTMLADRWSPPVPHTLEQPHVGPIGTPDGVRECLAALGGTPSRLLAAEVTSYAGKPAVVLATHQGEGVVVYAANLPCVRGSATLLTPPVTGTR
ncbi:hypothetical protein [Arsenicicoccus dermatophilus]|uniref:hypothetical protein n=1 Tax=Arsenicicoccus dermatophilus TaxID=1076331 RepID=UPI001F4C9529|nr:hypothetical protein [Arsenicicoccus dermatophilus]MCH8614094.1 hypothetical protein [Arsenicicoccus dermatophilus]